MDLNRENREVKTPARAHHSKELEPFLEKPEYKQGYCKYKTRDGIIREAPSFCFANISKGNKFSEYETKEQYKVDLYARYARRKGYRVEKNKLNDFYLLKIFGDTQEEVDDFVGLLKKNLIIDNDYE